MKYAWRTVGLPEYSPGKVGTSLRSFGCRLTQRVAGKFWRDDKEGRFVDCEW